MNFIQQFLSDPIWNGIQGMIALIMFLIYLWGKKDNWLPVIKKMGVPIRFFAVTILFVLAGWVMPTMFCFIPLIILVVGSQDLSSTGAYAQQFQQKFVMLPQVLLLMATAPTLASMTSPEKKVSERRAITAGIVGGVATIVYGFFTGSWSEYFYLLIENQPNSISPFALTIFAFVSVLINMIIWIAGAILIGLLAHEGAYRFRNTFGSIGLFSSRA